jgi:hypothetical protein
VRGRRGESASVLSVTSDLLSRLTCAHLTRDRLRHLADPRPHLLLLVVCILERELAEAEPVCQVIATPCIATLHRSRTSTGGFYQYYCLVGDGHLLAQPLSAQLDHFTRDGAPISGFLGYLRKLCLLLYCEGGPLC